jgi:hypothetical protein
MQKVVGSNPIIRSLRNTLETAWFGKTARGSRTHLPRVIVSF